MHLCKHTCAHGASVFSFQHIAKIFVYGPHRHGVSLDAANQRLLNNNNHQESFAQQGKSPCLLDLAYVIW